jgi:hypothetical protein
LLFIFGLYIGREAGMHELFKSQGIGRCVCVLPGCRMPSYFKYEVKNADHLDWFLMQYVYQ